MSLNYLLLYSEQLATDIELLCQNLKAPLNTVFQIRNGQSKADMLFKFEISLKECSERKAG